MLHTFQIRFTLRSEHIRYLNDANDIDVLEIGKHFGHAFYGVSIGINRNPFNGTLSVSMIVDVPSMLDRGEVTERDLPLVKIRLKDIMASLFGDQNLYHRHRLMRIDYRFDAVIEEKSVREAYIKLFGKSYRKKARRLKELGRINVQGIFEAYETGLEHVNGSVETAVYDKMAERKAKNKLVKEYERDVLRFEVRLKKDFLAYQRRRYDVPRTLEAYFSEEKYREMMQKYILETYLTNGFFRYSLAAQKVKGSQFSVKRKKSIEKFLKTVSRGDLSSPQNSIAPATFKNRLADCEELGFHPITLPNAWREFPNFLPNPLASLNEVLNND